MVKMDLKGINWVGHIYQKYEAMLLEVEEDIYQDVVNYVENQVQTVGDSVKKFYSDVMEDLLPPLSPERFKGGDSDLSVEKYAHVCVCKRTKAGKEEPVNAKAERVVEVPKVIDMEVENRASFFHGLSSVNSSCASSSADSLNGSSSELYSTLYEDESMHDYANPSIKVNTEKKNLYPFSMTAAINSLEGGSGTSWSPQHVHKNHEASRDETAESVLECDEIGDESKYESDVSIDAPSAKKCILDRSIHNKDYESKDMSSSHQLVSVVESTMDGDGQCCTTDITRKEVDEVIASNSGKEADNDRINNRNTIDHDFRTIQHSDNNLKLEDTCVMVNGDDIHFVTQRKGKSKPSKKKIRDALSLKKKPARTQEYEQLAAWYADNASSDHRRAESLKPAVTKEDNISSATSESEWELL